MQDETQFIEKSQSPPDKKGATVVETQSTTNTKVTNPRSDESMLGGISGRFWIALILAAGVVAVAVIGLVLKDASESVFNVVFAGLLGLASNNIGTYMGQHVKPKAQT